MCLAFYKTDAPLKANMLWLGKGLWKKAANNNMILHVFHVNFLCHKLKDLELKSCTYKEAEHHHQSSCYLCGLLIGCFCFTGFLRWVMEIERQEIRTTSLWAWSKLQKWFHIPEFNSFSILLPLETRRGLGWGENKEGLSQKYFCQIKTMVGRMSQIVGCSWRICAQLETCPSSCGESLCNSSASWGYTISRRQDLGFSHLALHWCLI